MRSEGFSRIYFFTPFFGYTGSEVALFNLICRIKNFDVVVISRTKGSLAKRLPESVRYFDYQSFKQDRQHLLYRIKAKVSKRESLFEHFLNSVIEPSGSLFYVNTILMPDVVSYLVERNYRFVLHAHELQQMLNYVKPGDIDNMVGKPEFVFTSSETCKQLWYTLGRRDNIQVSYPGVDVITDRLESNGSDLRRILNISQDAFVIAMSGTLDSNKNPEGFLELGRSLRAKGCNIHLLWIGVHEQTGYNVFLSAKTRDYDLEEACSWIDKLDGGDYLNYLNLADCFVLTSFRESFSIVVVEALALGKPVITFKSGGPQEILNEKSIGLVIDDYSVDEMASSIEGIISGQQRFDDKRARKRASDFHPDVIFQGWSEIIQRMAGDATPLRGT